VSSPFVCFQATAFSANNSKVRPAKRSLQVLVFWLLDVPSGNRWHRSVCCKLQKQKCK